MKKLILTIAALVTMSTSAFAQLGSTDKDLVYTPVTPCRVLDTRTSQGGTGEIAANSSKHFKVWGQTSFAAQGGAASNCGLTAGSDVAAIAMNFTVVTPASGGFITAYPFGGALPVAATVNFQIGDIARGDFTIAKITQTGSAATNHLSVFSTSNADVVGDVVGFYSRPFATALNCNTVESSTVTLAAGAYAGLTTLFCAAGFTPVNVYFSAVENVLMADSYISGQSGQAFVRSFSANSQSVTSKLRCCQLSGR
jgi:hypothetical protein